MKRFLSLVLSLAMILPIMLAATPALAEENPYAEHLTFKVFTIDGSDDMFNWPLVKQAMEKFNFDFEIQLVAWDSWDESTRTLAYTQSLPEVIAWYNLNKDEYLEWVEEGVFKALPDDMSAYPNLEKLINSYTCFDQFRVDGKLYTFPKIKNSNPVNLYTTYMFAYRRDWAKAMGYDWAPVQTLTYDEFVAYLRDVKEKDPGHMGDKLVPLDLDNGGKHWAMLAQLWNQRIGSFDIVDGQYCWSAEDPSSLEAIKQIKTLYDDGLLAMDSYNDSNNAGRERFLAGSLCCPVRQPRCDHPADDGPYSRDQRRRLHRRRPRHHLPRSARRHLPCQPDRRVVGCVRLLRELPRRSHGSLAGGRQLAARTGTD